MDESDNTTPPLISGPSGNPGDPTSSISIAENIPTVHTFTADEPVSWTLVGSDDDDKLTIDPIDGVLLFRAPPDYENPNDIGDTPGNNTYIVTVRATDDDDNIDDQIVTITVTDVDEEEEQDFGPIDITDATDSGDNDNLTSYGNPILTFTGIPGLSITIIGPDGLPITPGSYNVDESTTNSITIYTVNLIDADPNVNGNLPFGDFFQGIATGNSPNTGDGTFIVVSNENNGSTKTIGSIEIETIGQDLDNDGADDIFESQVDIKTGQLFDRNGDGTPDYKQRTVATFAGSEEQPITIEVAMNAKMNTSEEKDSGRLSAQTSLLYNGLADNSVVRSKDTQLQPQTIIRLENAITSNPNNQGITDDLDLVLATTDQPNFTLIPEITKTGTVTKKKEKEFTEEKNQLFRQVIHEISLFFNERESGNWNALFKPDDNGDFFFYGYNPATGLGGVLVDRDDNGRIDGAIVYLKDNELGDLNPEPFIIDDPIGMAELAKTPELIQSASGNSFYVDGLDGTGLWLKLNARNSNANWQNTLLIYSSLHDSVRSIGATAETENYGSLEIFVAAGEEITFSQRSNASDINDKPQLKVKQSESGITLSLEDNGSDDDFNDLVVDIHSSLTPSSTSTVRAAGLQQSSHDALLDFSWIPNEGINIELEVNSNCYFRNTLAFVSLDIDPLTGKNYTDYQVNGVSAFDQNNYQETILERLIYPNDNPITAKGQRSQIITWEIAAADAGIYSPILITEKGDLMSAGLKTARDGKQHVKTLGDNHFAFEDLMADQKPDWDYDDVVVKATVLSA